MRIYDATGRLKIAALWAAISGVPARVKEIEVLADPGQLEYVGWNDTSNQLELFEFDALDIPYDNSGSGLAATNVQDAIDEVEAAASPNFFSGFVDFTGLTGNSDLPSGWTVSLPGAGRYIVTHSLGLSPITDLRIVVTQINAINFGHFIYVFSSANSFEVNFRNVANILQSNSFYFLSELKA